MALQLQNEYDLIVSTNHRQQQEIIQLKSDLASIENECNRLRSEHTIQNNTILELQEKLKITPSPTKKQSRKEYMREYQRKYRQLKKQKQ